MKKNITLQRNNKLILETLSEIFSKEKQTLFKGELVSISFIELSGDLSNAKIYISTLKEENKNKIINQAIKNKYLIKKKLVNKIKNKIRKVPEINFILDNNVNKVIKINSILENI